MLIACGLFHIECNSAIISILSPKAFLIFSNGSNAIFISSQEIYCPCDFSAAKSKGHIFIAVIPESKRECARSTGVFKNASKSS